VIVYRNMDLDHSVLPELRTLPPCLILRKTAFYSLLEHRFPNGVPNASRTAIGKTTIRILNALKHLPLHQLARALDLYIH
jgi:hypothetical protein